MKRNLVTSLAIALLFVVGVEALAKATTPYSSDTQTVLGHKGHKCPGDGDDDCKDD